MDTNTVSASLPLPPAKPGRFDYVAYDALSASLQSRFKAAFVEMGKDVEQLLVDPRYKALVLTKLEEAYAFVGKAIRDDQVRRAGAAPLREGRGE